MSEPEWIGTVCELRGGPADGQLVTISGLPTTYIWLSEEPDTPLTGDGIYKRNHLPERLYRNARYSNRPRYVIYHWVHDGENCRP